MYLNVNAIFFGEAWQVLIGCVGFECRKLWSLGTGGFWVSSRPTVLNSCQSKHKGRTRVSVAPTNSRGIRLNSTGNVKITMMAVTFCQQRCTVSFLWTKMLFSKKVTNAAKMVSFPWTLKVSSKNVVSKRNWLVVKAVRKGMLAVPRRRFLATRPKTHLALI